MRNLKKKVDYLRDQLDDTAAKGEGESSQTDESEESENEEDAKHSKAKVLARKEKG